MKSTRVLSAFASLSSGFCFSFLSCTWAPPRPCSVVYRSPLEGERSTRHLSMYSHFLVPTDLLLYHHVNSSIGGLFLLPSFLCGVYRCLVRFWAGCDQIRSPPGDAWLAGEKGYTYLQVPKVYASNKRNPTYTDSFSEADYTVFLASGKHPLVLS